MQGKSRAWYVFLAGVRRALLQLVAAIEVYLRDEGEPIA